MILVGSLQQIQLAHILKEIEEQKKTGMLLVTQAEKKASLFFLRGKLTHINPHEQANAKTSNEVINNLLAWSTGEVYFDEVNPLYPLDQKHPQTISVLPTTPLPAIAVPEKEQGSSSHQFNDLNEGVTVKVHAVSKRNCIFLPREWLVVVMILILAAMAHAINMFHYPFFFQDEGTYMAQAWAVVHQGRLSYYTYWYDHAPAGWFLIAGWTILTGGFHTFGSAIASGRALMLAIQIGSTFMLYIIARITSRQVLISTTVAVLFAFSPIGVYFHRLVLLDNIATFWMLLSILLLLSGRLSLRRVGISALAFGISAISKEVAVFLFPAMAYLVFYCTDKSRRWLAVSIWITLALSVISLYPLMAVLKNELFPSGTLLGGIEPHVSLLGSIQLQAARGKDAGILSFSSGFWQRTWQWLQSDPVLVGAGSMCAVISAVMIRRHRITGIMGLLSLSLWAFLARGGEVLQFYITPVLPLLALNIGLLLSLLTRRINKWLISTAKIKSTAVISVIQPGVIILCLIGMGIGLLGTGAGNAYSLLWSSKQADSQNQAVQWVENNLPTNSHIIIDESMWTDLYDAGYRFADYYSKVQDDPAIRDTVYHDDWRQFDYVVTTPELLSDMQYLDMTLVKTVVDHSTLVTFFDTGSWRIEVRKVSKE